MTKILFVCLGNICRSPTAEGLFQQALHAQGLGKRHFHDSCGTGGWHAGDAPEPRAVKTALKFGTDISHLRARKIKTADFAHFDLILAMDRQNLSDILALKPDQSHNDSMAECALYLDYCLGEKKNVPDPHYGTQADFDSVYHLCQKATEGLMKRLS